MLQVWLYVTIQKCDAFNELWKQCWHHMKNITDLQKNKHYLLMAGNIASQGEWQKPSENN